MIDYLGVLRTKGDEFTDIVRGGDLDAAVPCCPGWALRDLALHLGGVWAWARMCIESGAPADRPDHPVDDADLPAWLADQLDALVAILEDTDPQAATWTFGPTPRTVSFWHRRQAQEVTVHLWDAQSSVGTPEAIEATLAADGVAEVFEVILPRQLRLERMSPVAAGVTVRLPDGRTFDLGDHPAAVVTGDPSDLLLALWHRAPLAALTVSGDAEVARETFDRALTS